MSCNSLPQPISWFPPAPPAGLTFQQQMQWRSEAFAKHNAAVRAAAAKAHAACIAQAKAAAAAAAHAAAVRAAAAHAAAVRAAAAAKAAPASRAMSAALHALGGAPSTNHYMQAERIAAAAHPLSLASPVCGYATACIPGMSHSSVIVFYVLLALTLPVSYLISWGTLRRALPQFPTWGIALLSVPGAMILGTVLELVIGVPLQFADRFIGGSATAFFVVGWLIDALFIYLAEVVLLAAGWQRQQGSPVGLHNFLHPSHFETKDEGAQSKQLSKGYLINGLSTFVTKAGWRYLIIMMTGFFGIWLLGLLHALFYHVTGLDVSATAGIAMLIGMSAAALFHPPCWLVWNFVFNVLSKTRAGTSRGPRLNPPAPIRGTWLVDAPSAARFMTWRVRRPDWPKSYLPFGTQAINPDEEPLHTKILGATGSGKSTAIRAMLRTVAERPNQRCVIADPDGGYAARFFNRERGDIILNPFDARATGWDLFADIRQEYDPDNIASSLVPEKSGEQGEWGRYGQIFVAACIRALKAKSTGHPSPADLWRMIATAPPAVLAGMLAETEAAHFLARGNEKMFGSVRSTAAGTAKGLAYLRPGAAQISLSDYAQGNSRGWVFLTYTAEQIAALRSVYASMLRVLIFATMGRPEGDSGTWFVIDELDALGKIPGLIDALARLRKFGGRCVLGFQTIGQLVELYGDDIGAALVENCANTMILRCGGRGERGTSAYASSLLGKREVLKTQTQEGNNTGSSQGQNNQGWSSSTTTSQQVEDTLLASEVEQFANLSGVCHAPNFNFWSHFTLEPDAMPTIAPAFEARPVPVPSGPDAGAEPAGEPA